MDKVMMWLKKIATTVCIPIKQDATSGIIGVQRNTIYKIYATITGEGSKDPDTSELNACISFSIKVEPWTVITQTETDVN